MLMLLTRITCTCLICLTLLVVWHIISGREPSPALLALLGSLIGAIITKSVIPRSANPGANGKATSQRVED